jgi:tetratricopeptide (TPR) repeat protein
LKNNFIYIVVCCYFIVVDDVDMVRDAKSLGVLKKKGLRVHFKDPKKALELYGKAANSGLCDWDLFNRMADVCNILGDFGKALEYGRKSVDLKPDSAYTYDTIATSYAGLDEFEAAESYYLKALELRKDYPIAYENLANLYSSEDNYPKAEQTLLEGIKACKEIETLKMSLGTLYYNDNKPLKAIKAYKDCAKQFEIMRKDAFRSVSQCYCYLLKDYDKAIYWALKTLKIYSKDYDAHYILSYSYFQKSREITMKTGKHNKKSQDLMKKSVQTLGKAIANTNNYEDHKTAAKQLMQIFNLQEHEQNDMEKIRKYIR